MSPLLKGGVSVDNYGSVGPTIDGENNPTQGTWNNQDAVLTGYSGLNGTPNYNIKGPNGVLTGMITHTLDGPPPYLRNQQPSYAPYPLQAAYSPPLQGNVSTNVYAPTEVAAPIIPPNFNFLGGGPQALPTAGASYAGPSFAPLHGPQAAAPPGAIAPSNFNPGMPGGSGGGGRPTMPMPGPMPTGGGQSPTPVSTGGGQPLATPRPFMQPSAPPVGNYGSPIAGNGVMPAMQPGQPLKGPNPIQQAVGSFLGAIGKGANSVAGVVGLNQPVGASPANGLQQAPPATEPKIGPDGRPQAPQGAPQAPLQQPTPKQRVMSAAQVIAQNFINQQVGFANFANQLTDGLAAVSDKVAAEHAQDKQTLDGIVDSWKLPGGLDEKKANLMNDIQKHLAAKETILSRDENEAAQDLANEQYGAEHTGKLERLFGSSIASKEAETFANKSHAISAVVAGNDRALRNQDNQITALTQQLDRLNNYQAGVRKERHELIAQIVTEKREAEKIVLEGVQKSLDLRTDLNNEQKQLLSGLKDDANRESSDKLQAAMIRMGEAKEKVADFLAKGTVVSNIQSNKIKEIETQMKADKQAEEQQNAGVKQYLDAAKNFANATKDNPALLAPLTDDLIKRAQQRRAVPVPAAPAKK